MAIDLKAADELLTTTRSVRKRLDLTRPVPAELLEECIEIALQAPTGSNSQGWQFLFVTDAAKKRALADLYRKAFLPYVNRKDQPQYAEGDPRAAQRPRVLDSAMVLVEHLHEVPVHFIPLIEGRVENAPAFAQASVYGSILPAVWSFMLAARARGLGSAWTTLHLPYEKEAAELLGVPFERFTQVALLPVAYFTGSGFSRAPRLPGKRLTHWDRWGNHRS
jgi:nitroreductase